MISGINLKEAERILRDESDSELAREIRRFFEEIQKDLLITMADLPA